MIHTNRWIYLDPEPNREREMIYKVIGRNSGLWYGNFNSIESAKHYMRIKHNGTFYQIEKEK